MAISTKLFTTIVSDTVTAIQGAARSLVDLTVGSILRSFAEANAFIVLWLQGIALQLAALTRFATSSGTDADSWAADFGFPRLAAIAATGQVTFSRFTATNQASIALGTVVQTADGTQQYVVIADTTQTAYNAGTQTYVIPAGTASAVVTVQAVNAAAAANVSAGSISVLGQALAYVDTVSNAAAFVNGADAESDTAYRARFVSYIASLPRATKTAVGFAITSIKPGINYTLTENQTYAGVTQFGYFFVVVDDGTGSPSGSFLSAVSNAIDAYRPLNSSFGVFAPVVITAAVNLTLTTSAGFVRATVVAAVNAALLAYINSLPIGATLNYTRIASVAYGVAGVSNVSGVTINSGTTDLPVTAVQIVKAGLITIS